MQVRRDGSIGLDIDDFPCTGTVSAHDSGYRFDVDCGFFNTTGEGSLSSDEVLTVAFTGFGDDEGGGDIVYTMTGGNFRTSVVANEFYFQSFRQGQIGIGATLAVLLFILVIPVVIYQVRQLRLAEEIR